MAQSSTCRTFSQNLLFDDKNKLSGAAPTKGNNISAVSRALTPAATLSVVFALFFVAHYLEDDFQWIFRTILNSRPPTIPLAPASAL